MRTRRRCHFASVITLLVAGLRWDIGSATDEIFSRCQAVYHHEMSDFTVDVEREIDGRWIGEVPEMPGVLAYGASRNEAIARAEALAFRVLADRLEHGEDL